DDLFRSDAAFSRARHLAIGAVVGNRGDVAAVVAARHLVAAMKRHRHVALMALEDAAAARAVEIGRETTTVEKDQRLLLLTKRAADLRVELVAHEPGAIARVEAPIEGNDRYRGKVVRRRAARQLDEAVLAGASVVDRLE